MLSNLNEQQKEAVVTVDGPVMVFAGAGSGKTRTLTYRVAYMIKELKIPPKNILTITFTKKATNEMRERLKELIGEVDKELTTSTFHSLCARILRHGIIHLGYKRNFNIVDDEEQLKIINEVLKDEGIDRKLVSARHIQRIIKAFKSRGIEPNDKLDVKIMRLYESKMSNENLLDFDDLLIKTIELFEKEPEYFKRYENLFKYILVDEFQDTNKPQYKIVKMLAEKSRNLFVVGDDDQSIYAFRGANYANMQDFKKDFPEYKMFYLTENYRSPNSILKGCNRLIKNNLEREQKELFSSRDGSENDVVIYQAYNEKAEAEYIVDQVNSLRLRGVKNKEIAVLYRSSILLRNIELGMIQAGIPYKVYGGVPYLRRREIKDVVAYLKLIVDNDDLYSFRRVVNVPSRMLGEATLNKLFEVKNLHKITIFEAIEKSESVLSQNRYNKLKEFKDIILKYQSMLETHTLIDIYEGLLEDIGYIDYLKAEEDGIDRIDNVFEFKSILLEIEEDESNFSRTEKLEDALDQALLNDDVKQNQKESLDGILLSTIHSVKGLEFEYVFVIGLEDNVFPNLRRSSDDIDLEEERRIAYVAFTRAKEKLYLLTSQNRLLYGDRFRNPPSRFLIEFAGAEFKDSGILEQTNHYNFENYNKSDLLSIDDQPKYKPGDKVRHKKFGDGIIIGINDNIGQIFFDREKEIKSIMLNHPALNKI